MADDGADLGELLDGVPDLLVEDAAVGDDDDGVEEGPAVTGELDQLVGEPGDGLALAAAGGVLDQVAAADVVGVGVGEELADDVELVVAGEDQELLLSPLVVGFDDDLGVVFEDVGEAAAGEDLRPEVVGFEAIGVGRVAGAVVPALVEGEEPGVVAAEVGAEADLLVVDGEVDGAALVLEEELAGVAVALVLADGVVDGLLGEAVLELEGGDGEAVDEEDEVEGKTRLVGAVAELAGDAEDVGGEALGGEGVAGGGGLVVEADGGGAVIDPLAEDVDDAAPGDLALEAVEEAEAGGADLVEVELGDDLGLGGVEEGEELGGVDGVGAVVVVGIALDVVAGPVADALLCDQAGQGETGRAAGEAGDDEAFQAAFGDVSRRHRRHRRPRPG